MPPGLKNNQSDQARRRMYREVDSLKTLASAGVKVPRIIDGNTDKYEDKKHELYFVMEHIPGDTLQGLVERERRLSLDVVAAAVLDLAQTVARAHREDVQHRDLKPANIVVRSLTPPDLVIVDLGLSFNKDEQGSVTETNESMRNEFMTLPEWVRLPGHDQRDSLSAFSELANFLPVFSPRFLMHCLYLRSLHGCRAFQVADVVGLFRQTGWPLRLPTGCPFSDVS